MKKLKVVGIGSSAGGLEALQILFSNLKETPNTTYIVAQHLSPTHKSMMVELINRVSNISVQEAKNALVLKPNTIYISPENTDLYVSNGKIFLKSINHIFGPKPSVNYLLSSIAEEYKHNSIGIILSGTGSDGAYGIRAIKAEGGITICQSPSSSKYDGMPYSAINTGKVDLVFPINNLADELSKILENLGTDLSHNINDNYIQEIFKLLFEECGVDFSMYKKNTISRRLSRRMHALKINDLSAYLDFIKNDQDEIHALYTDILIGVTSFFRDDKVFEEIKIFIERLCEKKEQGEEIRLWSVGCSTGEEAYSLAILISETLKEKVSKYKIKIFATDIDEESLKIARAGVYSETSLINLDKKFIKNYFNVQKNQYEIKKSIREMVVFSKHNIVSDSPFLRMDLITCRNMLIYFNSALQQRVFPIFHYALNDNGILVLGKSETVADSSDLFYLVNKNLKIYKSQYTGIKEAPKLYNYGAFKNLHSTLELQRNKKSDDDNFENIIVESLLSSVLDKCLILNSSNEVIYNKGEIPFIKFPQGKMTHNIFKLIDENIVLDLRTAINNTNKTNKVQKLRFTKVKIIDDIYKYVRAYVIPFRPSDEQDNFNILFFETDDPNNFPIIDHNYDDNDLKFIKIKEELDTNKVHLQNVIEELETSYEETQSLNEELQSSNEELQSSNEELETTNEELQSTNEELQTAYSELKLLYDDKESRTELLEKLTEKLRLKTEDFREQKEISEAIINTVPVSILFVDDNGIITFVNENAKALLSNNSKMLINKSFNQNTWDFTDLNGQKIKDNNLPLNLIKKTFENIEDYNLNIKNESININVNLSGAPLFNSDGKFIGAVFSIREISKELQTTDKIDLLKELKDLDIYSNFRNSEIKTDLIKLLFNDLDINLRNKFNEINLLLNSVKNKKIEKVDAILHDLSGSLNDLSSYYLENSFTIVSLERTLIENLKIFKNIFHEKNIITDYKFYQNDDTEVLSRTSKHISMVISEFIIYISDLIDNQVVDLSINYYDEDIKIVIKSSQVDFAQFISKNLKAIESFNSIFSNLDMKSDFNVENTSLNIKIIK